MIENEFIVFYQVPNTSEINGTECKTLVEALAYAKQHRENGLRFVTIASEQRDCVSLSGVSDPPTDYNWRKRR